MALPKHKKSKSKTRLRRSLNSAMKMPKLNQCSNRECMEYIASHRVCPFCGHYKNRKIIDMKKEK